MTRYKLKMLSSIPQHSGRKCGALVSFSSSLFLVKELRKKKLFNEANACPSVSCAYQSLSTTFYHGYCFRTSENQIFGTSSAFSVSECQPSQSFRAMAWQEPHSGVLRTDGTSVPTLSLTIHNNTVEVAAAPGVTYSELRKAFDSILFKQWINNMKSETGILALDDRCCLKKVLIQSLDMFGERVGFLKFKAEVVDKATGSKLPGIVFARGGAVAILMVLECDGESYVVLTEQARVPVGRTILELPAGMLDDDRGDFVGTAAREVKEETGIHISSGDLVNLTAFLDPSTGNKMFPSPGGSDEEISLLLYKGHVKKEVVEALRGRETGLRSHGELIKLHIVPYKTLWRVTADSKALAAITLYEMAKKEGILPLQNTPELFSS